jgi:Ca-activated chloride channel homolog
MYLEVTYGNPWAWFFIVIPAIMLCHFLFTQSYGAGRVHVSSLHDFKSGTIKVRLRRWLPLLNVIAALLIVIAIARPQGDYSQEKSFTKGIDIVMAIDVSTSMLETDFKPSRYEAAKLVASEFVSKRPNDRIGVVIFAGESLTLCPPTIDHAIVQKQIKSIQSGLLDDGTAIGMGLATSVRALKFSNAKSKVCILLTDGVNTAGTIDPLTAVEIAKQFRLKVYCIGVGTPRNNILGIDEPLMQNIAKSTGGLYFRAGSVERLKAIYNQINELETIEIEKNNLHKKTDHYLPWLLWALGLIIVSFVLRTTWLRGVV